MYILVKVQQIESELGENVHFDSCFSNCLQGSGDEQDPLSWGAC